MNLFSDAHKSFMTSKSLVQPFKGRIEFCLSASCLPVPDVCLSLVRGKNTTDVCPLNKEHAGDIH